MYIESSDIGLSHSGTEFFDYLGIMYIADGGEVEVDKIIGTDNELSSDMALFYYGGTSPHYSVDRLETTTGTLLFSCDAGYGRMFINTTDEYQVISSSVVLGALANGDSLNLKPYLVSEIINKFAGYDPYTSVAEKQADPFNTKVSPNPFSQTTTLIFRLENAQQVVIDIFDQQMRLVRRLFDKQLTKGSYQIVWHGNNGFGERVSEGIYYYYVKAGEFTGSGKIIMVE